MPYSIKRFGEVQGYDDDVRFSYQYVDGVEKVDDGRSSRGGWAEGELVVELQRWRWRRQYPVNVVPHDDALLGG